MAVLRCLTIFSCLCIIASTVRALLIPNRDSNILAKVGSSPAADGLMTVLSDPSVWIGSEELDFDPDELDDYRSDWSPSEQYRPRKLSHFSWKTCGGASDLFQITNLTVSPDPIKLGNPVKVTASGRITTDLGSPIEVDVTVQKKVFVWVTLPCVDDIGSCTYSDMCTRLPPPPCPPPMVAAKLPCSCPFPAGTYTVTDLEVDIDTSKYPAWLSEGDFKAHIELKKAGQSIACYDVELNISS